MFHDYHGHDNFPWHSGCYNNASQQRNLWELVTKMLVHTSVLDSLLGDTLYSIVVCRTKK